MKAFVTVLAIFALANADFIVKTPGEWKEFRAQCIREHQVPAETVANFKRFEYPDDEKTQNYIRCVVTKLGLFDDQYGYYADHVVKQLSASHDNTNIRPEVEKCINRTSEHHVQKPAWAYYGFKCFVEYHLFVVKGSVKA